VAIDGDAVMQTCATSLLADSYDVGFYFNAGVLVFRPSKSDFSNMMGWLQHDAQTPSALQILGCNRLQQI
jgi:hypothetical protein